MGCSKKLTRTLAAAKVRGREGGLAAQSPGGRLAMESRRGAHSQRAGAFSSHRKIEFDAALE